MLRAAGLVFVLLSAPLMLAQPAPDAGTAVYSKVVRSTVWIQSQRGSSLATGTGSLIDATHRLVLTNYHVVGDENRVTCLFPAYRDGKPIAERDFYMQKRRELGIAGKVLARDRTRDLAVIQLDRIPDGVPALPLAPRSVSPGQTVHSLGNPGGSGALWVYTPGKVRQVYMKRWRADLDGRVAEFASEVVETDSATNPGDSGGPLVDDSGRLVAVTQGGALKANLLSTFIDISEVKKFLNNPETRRATGWDGTSPDKDAIVASRDGGRFFSESAWKAFQDTARKLHKEHNLDIVVETYANIPDGKTDRVKAMPADEKARFFKEWARARIRTENIAGALLIVTREPTYLHVEFADHPRVKGRGDDARKITEAVIGKFKEKKFDDGLKAFAEQCAELLAK
ncbi:MAG: trypsin-like peptidase domain-containing protein [Gemmataceae bacterium]|nr:trypsin-like peptidase domain-containing protein [Gemmataceae bacterium]